MSVSTVWRRPVLSVIRRNCCLQLQGWSMSTCWVYCRGVNRRNILVGVETRLRNVLAGAKFSFLSKASRPALKPPCFLFNVHWQLFLLRKAAGWWSCVLSKFRMPGSLLAYPIWLQNVTRTRFSDFFEVRKHLFNVRWGLNKACTPNTLLFYCCTRRPGWRFATDSTVRASNSARGNILRNPSSRTLRPTQPAVKWVWLRFCGPCSLLPTLFYRRGRLRSEPWLMNLWHECNISLSRVILCSPISF